MQFKLHVLYSKQVVLVVCVYVREAVAYCKYSAVEAAGAAPLGIFCCI